MDGELRDSAAFGRQFVFSLAQWSALVATTLRDSARGFAFDKFSLEKHALLARAQNAPEQLEQSATERNREKLGPRKLKTAYFHQRARSFSKRFSAGS